MKKIPMLEKFAAQSLVEDAGELIFSKEKFAELIVQECLTVINQPNGVGDNDVIRISTDVKKHFGVKE